MTFYFLNQIIFEIGFFEVDKEKYETLLHALKEITADIENINQVNIDNKNFKLELTQGGDLKWLANINGINAANSNCPCIWCHLDKRKQVNIDDEWSISGRTSETAKLLLWCRTHH